MADLLAVSAGLGAWWFGTVFVLLLGRIPSRLDPVAKTATAVAYGAALPLVLAAQLSTAPLAPYAAFAAAIVLWGTLELSHLRAWVTGPYPAACPSGATRWRRFRAGLATSLHHELSVIATGALLLGADAIDGRIGCGTGSFVVLWIMRWSAKLNLFLGVRNFNAEMLPAGMRYLDTYVRRSSMNPLYPWSVGGALLVLAMLLGAAQGPDIDGAQRTGLLLMSTLLGLAILEHLFMMLPFTDRRLWEWAWVGGKRKS